MAGVLQILPVLSIVLLLLSLTLHLVGLVSNYWCSGAQYSNGNGSEPFIVSVHFGLLKKEVVWHNGKIEESESKLLFKENQFVVMVIAGINAVLCLLLFKRVINIVVGISSFIMVTLMLLCTINILEKAEWTTCNTSGGGSGLLHIELSWSFYFVVIGLVGNTISTTVFLSVLLVKGEREERKTLKQLGSPVIAKDAGNEIHTVRVHTIGAEHSYENRAYNIELSTEWSSGLGTSSVDTKISKPNDGLVLGVSNMDYSEKATSEYVILKHDVYEVEEHTYTKFVNQ